MKNHVFSTRVLKYCKFLTMLGLVVLAACSGPLQTSTTQATTAPAQSSSVTTALPSAPVPSSPSVGSEPAATISATAPMNLPQTGGTQGSTQTAVQDTPAQQTTSPSSSQTAMQTTTQTASQPLACSTPAELTPAMTEGPYFKPGSPERSSLLDPGVTGTKLILSGYVLTTDCKPVAHALLDFWQANAQGQYDNQGYTLRGHLYTDQNGYYQLETIVPGLYPGRTEHIHVKVQAPNGPSLTTQLFFPGVSQNQSDQIFDQRLLMAIQNTSEDMQATYNFVVNPK